MTGIDALERTFSSSPIPTIILQVKTSVFHIMVANAAYRSVKNIGTTEKIVGEDFLKTYKHVPEIDDYARALHSVLNTKSSCMIRSSAGDISTYPILNEHEEVAFLVQQLSVPPEPMSSRLGNFLSSRPDLDLFDFSPVPMWVYDIYTLRILAANKAALADYGYTLSEFLNATVRILWPADDLPRMEEMVAAKVEKFSPNEATVRHAKRSGEIISVNIHSRRLPSWGKHARIVTAIDVSEKLKNEQAIKMHRDRLESLLKTTNGIVWEADSANHHFRYVSEYAEKVLGYAPSQWLAEPGFLENHIYPEDLNMVLQARDPNLEIGKTYSAEYRMLNAENNIVWIRDTYTPIIQDEKVWLRGLMVDVSIAKRAMAIDQLDKEILTNSSKEENSIQEVLNNYLRGLENQFQGLFFAMMSIGTGKLSDLASPSIPRTIITSAEDLPYPSELESGNASDAESAWSHFRETASKNGYKSVVHYPVHDKDAEVVAVFFVYHNREAALLSEEANTLERVITLLQLVLERNGYSKTLKESTIMMLQSQELARFGNWSWDRVSDVVKWSDTLYSIYGLSSEYVAPSFESYLNLVHPEDKENSFNIIQDLLINGKDRTFEERIVRPDGEVRQLKTWAKVIYGESGVAEKMFGASLDITESKKVEDELQASKSELQRMLDRYLYVDKATNDAIFDWDIQDDYIEWGESFTRLFGYSQLPLIYTLNKWFELVHPEDLIVMQSALQKSLANRNQHHWWAEYRIRKETGEYIFVEENAYILRDQSGNALKMIGVVRNITERKEAERNLQLSNEKYSNLFHLSPLPLFVYDLESLQILDVNQAAIENYGYSFEEFLSFTLRDIRPPQDIAILDEIIKKHVKAGHVNSSFTRHVKKSGKIILVSTKGNSIAYKGRNARIVVAIDNSERIKAEESLRQSERRFKTMIQEGSDLIVILDQTGKISYISPNIFRLFNLNPRDMMLTSPFDYIHKHDHAAIKSHLLNIRKDETLKVSPFRVRLKGGEIRWLETIITNKSHDPAIAGIIANSRDVTARMKVMLKNKELLERYNAVAKATSDTIWDSNIVTGKIIWNYSLAKIFGYDITQTSVGWWREHVHPEDVDRVNRLIESRLASGETRWMSEYRFRCADGTYKTVLDRGFIIFSDEGKPLRMIGCMQDVTQRVAYVHAIENHNRQLREIAWMQSHLVRAPLARILGITDILAEGGNSEDQIDELLSYLSVSAAELDDIIKGIIGKSQNLQ
ncbi:PAS domain S-box-containing protein [Arcticibacter pallidicorallinus]|uniref:histidine kinase n=1 Tax=Arcticibacter pallidicorallinus TaxID=1259464 RepID=A0A2T0U5G8_9SPHI|nr:PAS domain-containing protein [Arcticibacter pallidicorallinus]PRY53166.1 PAS domain S-box-containing protein [Arcticibacter pallidicorallinus]